MMPHALLVPALIAAASLAAAPAVAGKKTVCTITVNSADEKETFRERLPRGEYEFVELVEKGRGDWLRSACARQVKCDALVISGHFNAGETFYSDRLDRHEYLEIDELERASCNASCASLFSKLKEVYLFGCESLNPDATRYASAHGESGRERMRRIFAGVPVIYGFSSSAPVGPTAAMLLGRYFDGGARGEFASGRPSAGLLRAFSRNSMASVPGAKPGEPLALERRQVCRFFDERETTATRLGEVHAMLRGDDRHVARHLGRIEKLLAAIPGTERDAPGTGQALDAIAADREAEARFLALARRAEPETRARMVGVAGSLGWLTDEGQRDEIVAMVNDLLARPGTGFAEVDLVCSLNKDGALDGQLARLAASPTGSAAHAALRACLGSRDAHERMVRALASPSEKDVQVAQAYLRHRPVVEQSELRPVARDIARMSGAAQVRALDTLARLHISDREVLEELSRAFAATRSASVQRAIAEVFMRSDPAALPRRSLAATLREHRVKPPGGAPDLVDALLTRLGSASPG